MEIIQNDPLKEEEPKITNSAIGKLGKDTIMMEILSF